MKVAAFLISVFLNAIWTLFGSVGEIRA